MTCGSRVYDSGEQLYHLQTLSNLLRYSSDNAWSILTTPVEIEYLGLVHQNDKNDSTSEIEETTESSAPHTTAQVYLTRICLAILQRVVRKQEDAGYQMSLLRLAAISVLHQMMLGLSSAFVWEADLEIQLIETLTWSIKRSDVLLQVDLMNLILLALKLRTTDTKLKPTITHRRTISRDGVSQPSLSAEKTEKEHTILGLPFPPPDLLDCLVLGISSPSTHPVLEHWVRFLDDCLLLYADNAFQILLPLVNCFIKSLELVLKDLQASFGEPVSGVNINAEPVTTIITLFNGLEQILARAHDQLIRNDVRIQTAKTPEQIQGFFGNMVSGVFASEAHRSKTTTANNRLTVLLCFKDTVRICLKIWSWGDRNFEIATRNTSTSASYSHTSLRIKNRTRRTLEHLFVAEALECLETLIESYYKSNLEEEGLQPPTVFNLLNALDGSRPRNTIPAIFNGIYSRTNPNALDPARKSSLASDLSDIDLAGFLVVYTRSLEDDAMDEIWTDCMTFLRDVLANPLPHRQTLPKLLQFIAVLGEKVDNTNFGEQRRMRRDLSVRSP